MTCAALLLAGAAVAKLFAVEPVTTSVASGIAAGPAEPVTTSPVAMVANNQRRAFSLSGIDQIEPALADLGLGDSAAAIAAAARAAIGDQPGEVVLRLELARQDRRVGLARLAISRDDGRQGLVTPRASGGFQGTAVEAQLSLQLAAVRGEMGTEDFYSAAVQSGLPDVLIPRFAAALAFDFDFQREVLEGDVFEAAYERQVDATGRMIGQPRLVFVTMQTKAKSRVLYAFQPAGEEAGWFDGNGGSVTRTLMRTPVDGARVSSQFGFRIHPIRGYRKLHRGTDFAAPTGTAVYAAAGGVIDTQGWGGGAGNRVHITHENGWQTRYFHLSAFAPELAAGSRVGQGQLIGRVGSTGASTGPHLHYEVHIQGEPVNPLEIETGSGRTLGGEALNAFFKERDRIDAGRAAAR